jgi:hypothetical protein
VTSAHCFVAPIAEFGDQIVGFAAVVGGENGEAMEVVDVQIHPLYDGTPGSPFDVAMATIERVPNPPIGPLPLLTSVQTRVGDDVTTFGYGTSNRGEIGILKAADLSIDEIEDGNLVVVNSKPGDSICQGDSGGPLVKSVNGVTGLIGINSFGDATQDECADSGARIAGFVDIQNPATRSFILSYAADIGQS